MLNHNPNNDQDIERPPHFKNVFDQTNATTAAAAAAAAIVVSPNDDRRPSLAVVNNNTDHNNKNNNISQNSNTSNKSDSSSCVELKNQKLDDMDLDIELNDNIDDISTKNMNSEDASVATMSSSTTNTAAGTPASSHLHDDEDVDTDVSNNQQSAASNFQFLNLPSSSTTSIKKSIMNNIVSNNKRSTNHNSNKISKKPYRKYRSKSLPNIHIPSKRSHQILVDIHNQSNQPKIQQQNNQFQYQQQQQQQQQQQLLLLPPVNLQSMHEIDLQEVLKNPQLRHDILFDPQLQFRPNLDGERGRRKKIQSENYWNMIKFETEKLLFSKDGSIIKPLDENSPIIIMFKCLKSILVSLIPSKDITLIDEILDTGLLIQQLNSKCFNFIGFADWICSIFKLHCAPMRDSWVDELYQLFHKACPNGNEAVDINYLIEGLKTLFLILEAMKLDVANHQIRILRPALCSSAVMFEKEYFKNAVKRNKINFTASMLWFKKNSMDLKSKNSKEILNYSILNLLSCSTMCHQFPNTLNFDHTRLLLLRADIRHIICIKLCLILYKNLIYQNNLDKSLLNDSNILEFKKEILNIIVDENGNSKWTKNLKNLSIQMINKLFNKLDSAKIDFAYNWLLKQTQPNSKVYSLLESKLFEKTLPYLNSTNNSNNNNTNSTKISTNNLITDDIIINDELRNIVDRLNQLIDFNYNVFNEMYNSYLN